MNRLPRPRSEGVIRGPMLVRAWLLVGLIVAALEMSGFFYVLTQAGWSPGDPVGAGYPLHHAYQQATTMTFLGMIAGQIGTAFPPRTRARLAAFDRCLLQSLLDRPHRWGAHPGRDLHYTPPMQALLGTAALPLRYMLITLPYPLIVRGADELRRYILRRRAARRASAPASQAE